MSNPTKYPKFRALISNPDLSPRQVARKVCDQMANRLSGVGLDDLPDTAGLCNEVDEMESTVANWGIERNPSDEQIKALYDWAKEAVTNLLSEEGFEVE